ncbi:MAG: indole-3-glycerol phosphate synthase TrpC [Balneolaceae bacterium]
MSSILDRIVKQTRSDLHRRKRRLSLRSLESMECFEGERRGFRNALARTPLSVIAEVKRASPSRGLIRKSFDALKIADSYINGGASALSVLTDKPFFKGDLLYLEKISKNFDIPLLQKDFIIDPYQITEARAYGADAVLLIVSITEGHQLDELLNAAAENGLDALVECYSREEVDRLNWDDVPLFGVNNRDLRSFEVDLHRGVELLQLSPPETVKVSESGLARPADLVFLAENGIDAALIGEHFMSRPDPGHALAEMLEGLNTAKNTEVKESGKEDAHTGR